MFSNQKLIKKITLLSVLIGSLYPLNQSKAQVASGKGKYKPADITHLKFTVSEAPEWSALFYRNHGWLGADGIFAIPETGIDKPAKTTPKTMIIFSDTMVGDIVNGQLHSNSPGVHNSIAIMNSRDAKKSNIKFLWKEENGKPGSFFSPNSPNAKHGDYFWLGDGFVNPDMGYKTYIFAYRVNTTGTGAWDFASVGSVLIVLPKGSQPPFTDQKQMDTPFFLQAASDKSTGSFGAGIFNNTTAAKAMHPDGYVYVYGVKGKDKSVMVARVPAKNFEKFDTWRFWDGKSWIANMNNAAIIADRASDELSVSELPDGRYAMVFQTDGIGSTIGMRIGRTPSGPFGPAIKVWDCKDSLSRKSFYSYNAKAHPALSKPGEILISYNVNSFDWKKDINDYPNLYHPRFIRLKLSK